MQDFNTSSSAGNDIQYSDDFVETNEQYGTPFSPQDESEILRKRKIKSDVGSLIATIGINALPIITDAFRHRKDETPYRLNSTDVVRLGISALVPAIQALDTVCNKGRIQEKMEQKVPFTMSDIRNVTNIILTYPSAHRYVKNFMGNVVRNTQGIQVVDTSESTKREALLGFATIVAPYVVDKFSDESMTFTQKVSSVVPVKIFGSWVRRIADLNPKTRRIYDGVTAVVNVASVGNRELGNLATKSSRGQNRSAQNAFGAALDVIQDMTGMSRGRVGYGGDFYDNGYRGSRWGGASF